MNRVYTSMSRGGSGGHVSRRLPASKPCDGQGGLRSVVARVAIATGQLQMMMMIILKLCAR
jgi:hypothetical protein